MEKHSCKLCFRSFANGRALGGHMRSHMATLSIPPKAQQIHHHHHQQQQLRDETESPSSASSSSSSSSSGEEEEEEEEEEEKGLYYGLRENPKKSFRLVDPEFSFAVDAGSVVQDRESETESSKNPSRRRSKRNRKSSFIGEQRNLQQHQQPQTPELKKPKSSKPSQAESLPEPEPVSSVSDTTPEEDVARCLMMLSRDIWMRKEEEVETEEEQEEDEEEAEKSMEESDDSEELKFPTRTRGRYQCGTCKKVFRSYQALGGHRASHKKIRGCTLSSSYAARTHEADSEPGNAGTSTVDRKIHECPVCFRVFGSGQAHGGHKRSHLSGSVTATATNTAKFGNNLIDLNLPAPVEDDDMSQVELSAVSDAEFVDPTK
ncbi:zinc finger protein ZAT9-like [Telopea speciosissima]|uniref:zinc finger protein ZAT9-like n=1 Tax=Telopea speciosissima TaxID=54955 RepID=UPI001CC4386B|nr:zinc finger protein ZAT9-like [Telopea speciosissima]